MQILIRNEMGQKLLLTEELFVEILDVAEKHGWQPRGTGQIMSSQPSITDYLPHGIDGYRTVSERDAIGIHVALRTALGRGVLITALRSDIGEGDGSEDVQVNPRGFLQWLVDFFQRGWVLVCRWGGGNTG